MKSEQYKGGIESPEEHAEKVVADFSFDAIKKYQAGQEEHGGRLWRKPVLEFAWEEVLDLPVYMHTLRHQHHKMKEICAEGLSGLCEPSVSLQKVFNILTCGNPEGVREAGD